MPLAAQSPSEPQAQASDAADADSAPSRGAALRAAAHDLRAIDVWTRGASEGDAERFAQMSEVFAELIADPMAARSAELCETAASVGGPWLDTRGSNRTDDPAMNPELIALLDLARGCDSVDLHHLALRALGHAIGPARAAGWTSALQEALIRYTALTPKEKLRRVDGRYAVPLLETLFDIRDLRGLERMLDAIPPGAAAQPFANYRELIAKHPRVTLAQDLPRDCRPTLDGEGVRGREISIVVGTWVLGCEGQGPSRILTTNAQTRSLASAEVIAELAP